ncbi:cysteine sulfinic acid decarboxylase-like isoform X2 [Lineus longissimus]
MDSTGKNGCDHTTNSIDAQPYAFLERVSKFMVDELKKSTTGEQKVIDFYQPDELREKIDLKITQKGDSEEHLMKTLKDVVKYSVKTSHPYFFNQLFVGPDEYALAGACLTETLNSSQYTYEMGPVFTLMEKLVFRKMMDLAGWSQSEGEGIFCPGGSISNMYGLNLARFNQFPEAKEQGMQSLPQMCVFSSTHCHYSLKKGAAFLGFGTKNLIPVNCDEGGKMCPRALEAAIQKAKDEGLHPLMVNATAGTTVVGAYDPLNAIADICKKHKLWMHVDAAWGGSVLMSSKHRRVMEGIERADSMVWNPHKMLGIPQQCSAFLTRHQGLLKQVFSADARYLFQQDKFYDVSYDTGDASIQCARKIDVLKFWLSWKAHGDVGMQRRVDHAFDMAQYLATKVKETEGFRLVFEPTCTNVCFYYIPPSMRGQEKTEEWWQKIGKVGPAIKERMIRKGSMMIGYQPLEPCGLVNFIRMVIHNPALTEENMDFVVEEIDRLGRDL